MVSLDRWTRAQQYEAQYWDRPDMAETVAREAPASYGWRATRLSEELARAGLRDVADGTKRVIEVGSGPVGLARYFPGRQKVAVDPLHAVYAGNAGLALHRAGGDVDYREGRGESLPCPSEAFDLAIIENCIDHCQDMGGVMRELHRVLAPGGVLYLTVNCRSSTGYYMHRLLSRLRIDPGHPHTFTPDRAELLLQRHGFTVRHWWAFQSHAEAWRADLRSSSRKDNIKALLNVSEYPIGLIGIRSDSPIAP